MWWPGSRARPRPLRIAGPTGIELFRGQAGSALPRHGGGAERVDPPDPEKLLMVRQGTEPGTFGVQEFP